MTDRVAVVTGGASGMGAATVALLRAQGVAVGVLDVSTTPAVDVSDADAVDAAVARVRDELGPIDIVVNAAGIGTGGVLEDPDYTEVWELPYPPVLHACMRIPVSFVCKFVVGEDLVTCRSHKQNPFLL